MRRRFSIIQWEALALLLIGISVNPLLQYLIQLGNFERMLNFSYSVCQGTLIFC